MNRLLSYPRNVLALWGTVLALRGLNRALGGILRLASR